MQDIQSQSPLPVPLHLRNATFDGQREEGIGIGYEYPHSHPGGWVEQSYWPEGHDPKEYYTPTDRGREERIGERLRRLRDRDA